MSDERFNVLWTIGMDWFGWYSWGGELNLERPYYVLLLGLVLEYLLVSMLSRMLS